MRIVLTHVPFALTNYGDVDIYYLLILISWVS